MAVSRLLNRRGFPPFLAGQQFLHVLALRGHVETGRAALVHHRQAGLAGEVGRLALPHVDQRTDHPQVSFLDHVVGLHRLELAAVKRGHQEALRQVIEVLGKCQHVVAVFPGGVVHHSALHPRAEGAVRVVVHVLAGQFQNRLAPVEVGHAEGVHVGDQRGRVEAVGLRVDRDGAHLEVDRGAALKMQQEVQQRKRVLAAGESEQHAVAVADQVVIADGAADLAEEGLRGRHGSGHAGEDTARLPTAQAASIFGGQKIRTPTVRWSG